MKKVWLIVIIVLIGIAFYLGYLFSSNGGVEPPTDVPGDSTENYVEISGVKVSTSCQSDDDCSLRHDRYKCGCPVCTSSYVPVNTEDYWEKGNQYQDLNCEPLGEGDVCPSCISSLTVGTAKCENNVCVRSDCAQDNFGDQNYCFGRAGEIVPSCDCNTCRCQQTGGISCTEIAC
jgi:hypothetical protein